MLTMINDITRIYNGTAIDCMEEMQAKNEKVNLILTSPPYNTSKRFGYSCPYSKRYDIHNDASLTDYVGWTINHFKQFDSILEKDGAILYNLSYGTAFVEASNLLYEILYKISAETNFVVADTIIWKKSNALPNNGSKNKLTRITEFIFVIVRKEEYKTFNTNKKVKQINHKNQKFYHSIPNFIVAKNNDAPNKLNKATFSSELVDNLLDIYYVDGTVFDPFNGTGTTTFACNRRNIPSIGSEISEQQTNFAVDRINDYIGEVNENNS